ncbi:M18 family aminopeptidase [uncultured Selenomonas sp.]|uniref:M18 family aminopeptidase n=1 Tax=uncultured Selenomonas sp. TaxID=159275 RepID=UPI0028D156BA|nr:M18 family aminopeptidase [uncultured Selenomonas sp.]
MRSEEKNCAEELLAFIAASPSPYHAAERGRYQRAVSYRSGAKEKIREGERYHFALFGTGAVLVSIGENPRGPLHIACAHTDFPCLRIKPNPILKEHGYGKLNAEVYGGMIRNTWMDRPLSLAGAVALRSSELFAPELRLVDIRRPLMIVPNLAIHMNRKVNEGIELKPQKDLLPLLFQSGSDGDDVQKLQYLLADELGVQTADILSYDLNAYPYEHGCLLGLDEEFLSAARLDNLSSVKACTDALDLWAGTDGIRVTALFDNEEVGSRTKQGAGSAVLAMLLERIYAALGIPREEYLKYVMDGFCLSVDVAHALHPNAPEKADPTNQPVLGGGVVLKVASNQSYAGDAAAFAAIAALCERERIPYQVFTNHSDAQGGATLGSILSSHLPMRTMDIGVPILGMHSARETMGTADQLALTKLIAAFFSA